MTKAKYRIRTTTSIDNGGILKVNVSWKFKIQSALLNGSPLKIFVSLKAQIFSESSNGILNKRALFKRKNYRNTLLMNSNVMKYITDN